MGMRTGRLHSHHHLQSRHHIHHNQPDCVHLVAEEAGLVPVLLLVGQVLGVDPDDLSALVTVVGEHILVTLKYMVYDQPHDDYQDHLRHHYVLVDLP